MGERVTRLKNAVTQRTLSAGDALAEGVATGFLGVQTSEMFHHSNQIAGEIGVGLTAILGAKTLWDARGVLGHSRKIVAEGLTRGLNMAALTGATVAEIAFAINPPFDNRIRGVMIGAAGYTISRVGAFIYPRLDHALTKKDKINLSKPREN